MVLQQAAPAPPSQPEIPKGEATQDSDVNKQVANAPSATSPPKVDFATDLFNLLSMGDPSENPSESANNNDNDWAGFQGMHTKFNFL